jgi:hypothetical protein
MLSPNRSNTLLCLAIWHPLHRMCVHINLWNKDTSINRTAHCGPNCVFIVKASLYHTDQHTYLLHNVAPHTTQTSTRTSCAMWQHTPHRPAHVCGSTHHTDQHTSCAMWQHTPHRPAHVPLAQCGSTHHTEQHTSFPTLQHQWLVLASI